MKSLLREDEGVFCSAIAAGKYTLARDEIQERLAALDDIRRTSRDDDIPSLRLG